MIGVTAEIARHQLEQQRLAERLREQEERLKGLNPPPANMGLLPSLGGPAPLFPPIMGDSSRPPDVSVSHLVGRCNFKTPSGYYVMMSYSAGRDATTDGSSSNGGTTSLHGPAPSDGTWTGEGLPSPSLDIQL